MEAFILFSFSRTLWWQSLDWIHNATSTVFQFTFLTSLVDLNCYGWTVCCGLFGVREDLTKKTSGWLASSTWFIFLSLILVFCTMWLYEQSEKCQKHQISTLTGGYTSLSLYALLLLNPLHSEKPLLPTYKTTSGTTASHESLQSLQHLKTL